MYMKSWSAIASWSVPLLGVYPFAAYQAFARAIRSGVQKRRGWSLGMRKPFTVAPVPVNPPWPVPPAWPVAPAPVYPPLPVGSALPPAPSPPVPVASPPVPGEETFAPPPEDEQPSPAENNRATSIEALGHFIWGPFVIRAAVLYPDSRIPDSLFSRASSGRVTFDRMIVRSKVREGAGRSESPEIVYGRRR